MHAKDLHLRAWRGVCLAAVCVSAWATLIGCGGSGEVVSGGPMDFSFTAPIVLDSPDPMTLTVSVKGTTATGTLVNPAPALSRSPGLVPPGTHSFTGSYDPAGSYDLSSPFPGGVIVRITGDAPGPGREGEFTIRIGGEVFTGGLLPTDSPKPALVPEPVEVLMEPTQKAILNVNPSNMPEGIIKFRWFIAAPSAYFTTVNTSTLQGQDLWVDSDRMVIQTGSTDSGVLKAHVHAFLEKDGVLTFLAGTFVKVALEDVRFMSGTWVKETAQNPKGGEPTVSFFWEFPTVAGAKEYVAATLNANGKETTKHLITGNQMEGAPVTTIPFWVGVQPHSAPPQVPSTNMFGGQPNMNIIRRGNAARVLMCINCNAESEARMRDNNPLIVKVKL